MKILLVAINAKYIHSNLGVYSLKAYAEQQFKEERKNEGGPGSGAKGLPGRNTGSIEIGEYTINNQMDRILADIFLRKPDVVGFSCYIWNIAYVTGLIRDLHNVLPETQIWLGGPEVSYDAGDVLAGEPAVTGVMLGEGEAVFAAVASAYMAGNAGIGTWRTIPGTAYRDENGRICVNPAHPVMDMSRIPFSYQNPDEFKNRIIYYESSRGCPFSCSYCLSSIDRSVRFRDLKLVKEELAVFLERRVPQVKFVDRTFNCKKSHAMAIWEFIEAHDNGVTNFHFEISADLLGDEELALIGRLRPGLIQLEIGVQTTHLPTLEAIRRTTDLDRLRQAVAAINQGGNVHQHLDLIVGLPYEDFERFKESFDDVYRMCPEQLQLGFLKILKGSYMEEMVPEYGIRYHEQPPYEVLSTRWISYAEILRLKDVEEMVEVYYNSRQFVRTISELEKAYDSPFALYENLAQYYQEQGLGGLNHSRLARYEILHRWIADRFARQLDRYRDLLMEDLYLRENIKSRPSFAPDQTPFKEMIRSLMPELRSLGNQVHVEVFRDNSVRLFDYRSRDALTHNAKEILLHKTKEK